MPENLPSLDALRAFLLVAETRAVKTAAHRLGVTPSAVSQALVRLERDLGTELFQRDVRPLRPSAAGRALMPEARAIVEAAATLRHRVSTDASEMSLRLGLSETVGATFAPWLLAALRTRVARLEMQSGFTAPLTEALRNGDVDVLIAPEALLNEDRWVRERLYEEDFLLVVSQTVPFPETTEALRRLAVTNPVVDYGSGSSDEVALDRILRSLNVSPLKRLAVGTSHALVGLVAQTGGWSVIPATNLWCGRTFIDAVRFGALPEGRRSVRTMWATGDALCASEAVRLTARAARKAFEEDFLPEMLRTSPALGDFVRPG